MIKLYPYIINDGVPSLKDSELVGLYKKMSQDESLNLVFWNRPTGEYGVGDWLDLVKTDAQLFVIMTEEGEIAGMCWLTNIMGRRADIHYCMFKEFWGKSDELCKEVPELLFDMTNLNCIVATIPEFNKYAFGKPLVYGFTGAGTIPNLCWIPALGESVPGHIYYITRET